MPDAQKKAILRRNDGESIFGYLPPAGFVDDGACLYLDLEGRSQTLPLEELKTIFFVRDFNRSDASNPERLSRRTYLGRPRGEGLWVRLTFRSGGDLLEGLASTDLSLLTGILADQGLHLIPPDTRSNTLRVFVPRQAMAALELLGVVGLRPPRRSPEPVTPRGAPSLDQESLFPADPASPPPRSGRGYRS